MYIILIYTLRVYTHKFPRQCTSLTSSISIKRPTSVVAPSPATAQSLRTAPRPHGRRSCARWHAPGATNAAAAKPLKWGNNVML